MDIPKQTEGLQRDVVLHRLRYRTPLEVPLPGQQLCYPRLTLILGSMSGPNAFNIPLPNVFVAWLRAVRHDQWLFPFSFLV